MDEGHPEPHRKPAAERWLFDLHHAASPDFPFQTTEHLMVTEHTRKPAQSAERKGEAAERRWSNTLNMWHVCANTACQRARCCRGSPSYCYRHNFPQLPDGVKDWWLTLGEFQAEGLPFEEAWKGLEKAGLVAEFSNWHDLAHGKHGGEGVGY